jgi:uncharacterized protein (TIGR03545 family)
MKKGRLKKSFIVIGVLVAFIALLWWGVVDRVVEMVIESQGSKAVGAKVDVSSADLSLWPAGLEVVGIQVTDPANPMRNALSIQRVYSDIELSPLLKRKIIIDNLRMEGIRLNTPRKTSGALASTKRSAVQKEAPLPPWLDQLCQTDGDMAFTLPNVKDILSGEQLQSLQLAEELRNRITEFKSQWQQKLKDLPSKDDFEAIRSQLAHLKGSKQGLASLLGSAKEIQKLQADLKGKLDRIQSARTEFQSKLADLKQRSAHLTKAPMEDVQRLKAKYALSPEGAANLSRMLFGPKICDWWKTGYRWYARFEPYLGDMAGGSSTGSQPGGKAAKPKTPPPFFLIRQLHIDALLDVGKFTGQASDITSVPEVLGKPMTFKLLGRQLKTIQSIDASGAIDLIHPDHPKEAVKLWIKQFALQNLDISDSEKLPLSIAKAMADINLDLNLTGPKLDALVKAQLNSVQMAMAKVAGNELEAALAQAIEGVTRFGLTTLIQGSAPDYTTKIHSDIDQVLQQAVAQIVRKAGDRLETELQEAVSEKTKGAIDGTLGELKGVDALGAQFAQRENLGNDLLKNIGLPF